METAIVTLAGAISALALALIWVVKRHVNLAKNDLSHAVQAMRGNTKAVKQNTMLLEGVVAKLEEHFAKHKV